MDATNGRRKYCFRFCQCISVSTVTRTLVGRTDFSPRAEAGNFISRVEQLDFWRQGRILKMAAPKSKYECKNKENIFNLRFYLNNLKVIGRIKYYFQLKYLLCRPFCFPERPFCRVCWIIPPLPHHLPHCSLITCQIGSGIHPAS